MKQFYGVSLLIFFSGCMVGPNYTPPENTISEEWASMAAENPKIADAETLIEWWNVFNDPLLNKYIEQAAIYNEDVLAAEANILQARALRQVAAASLFPKIGVDANAVRMCLSKNGLLSLIEGNSSSSGAASPFLPHISQFESLYNFLFDATWEIDLFGKTRRAVEAAEAQIGSAIEQRNDIFLSVMAEIARNYVEIRSNQKLVALTEENIALLERNAAITFKNMESGYANRLDFENIEAVLATARSTLPNLVAEIYKGIYTISVLTGEPPEVLLPEMLPMQPLPQIPNEIAVGLKSDLLRRRPDIRYAERQLAAATANIGVAVASFFPTVTLLGGAGLQSLKLDNLFSLKSKTWALGGDIHMPLFQGGRLVGNLRANREATAMAAHHYQQTVLNALQEAESTLISYMQDIKTTNDLNEAVKKNRILVQLTEERYQKGLIGLISVLDIERQFIIAEENLLNSETSALIDLIALYKSLGGGWEINSSGCEAVSQPFFSWDEPTPDQ